jgi:uncharacterized protein YndB with AHSA1/START domain
MTDLHDTPDPVVIERVLDAPVGRVWQLWTDPAHFAEWYGPTGASVPVARFDLRAGGTRLVGMEMETPGGPQRMWFTGEYREVVDHKRLVYTEALADEQGNVLPATEAGLPDGHPVTTEVTVELEDLGDRTKMVVTHLGIPADSPGAAGWNMALDKLTDTLRTDAE